MEGKAIYFRKHFTVWKLCNFVCRILWHCFWFERRFTVIATEDQNVNILPAFCGHGRKMINDVSTWIKNNVMEVSVIKLIFTFRSFRHIFMLQGSFRILQKLLRECKYCSQYFSLTSYFGYALSSAVGVAIIMNSIITIFKSHSTTLLAIPVSSKHQNNSITINHTFKNNFSSLFLVISSIYARNIE